MRGDAGADGGRVAPFPPLAPLPTLAGTPETPRSRVATVAAAATLIIVPLVPAALSAGTPLGLVGIPAESLVAVLVLVVLPGSRSRRIAAGVFGILIVVAIAVALLDVGFEATIDRAFDPVEDGQAIVRAVGVVSDAVGAVGAGLFVAAIVAALAATAIALARAALRVRRDVTRAGAAGRRTVTAVAAVWIVGSLVGSPGGARLPAAVPFASARAAATLTDAAARTVRSLGEEEAFRRALAVEPLRDEASGELPGALLGALAGKDVVIVFVESYGEVAVHGTPFAAGVDEVLQAGGAQLARDGYGARSALLASPTFGGVSWLAHSTLQTGVWVDSQRKYDALTASNRLSLARIFGGAGWRTVSVVPSDTEPWVVGSSFYGYDELLDARTIPYAGPAFGYARIPDQYTLQAFHDRVLAAPHEPVMAEIDLVSSHTPWTPLPTLVPWSALGDGSVFDGQTEGWPSPVEAWTDPRRVQELYGQSIEYALGAVFSYLHVHDEPDLVLVLLGDHQPARIVSGEEADHDVPITIVAKDPAVLERIASWQWEPGVQPSPAAPVWRMDEFRDRFVDAFSP